MHMLSVAHFTSYFFTTEKYLFIYEHPIRSSTLMPIRCTNMMIIIIIFILKLETLSLSDHPYHRHLNLHEHCVGAWAFMAPPTCVCTFTWLISTEQSSSPSNLASHHISSQVPTTESAITTYRLSNMEQTWLMEWVSWFLCGLFYGCPNPYPVDRWLTAGCRYLLKICLIWCDYKTY